MSVKIPWFSSHLWHSHEQFSDVVIFILFLNSNQLSGDIPEFLCGINANLEQNQFCPPYPDCFEVIGPQDTSDCVFQTGDLTQDGLINIQDIIVLVDLIFNIWSYDYIPTDEEFELANIHEDDLIDIIDIVSLVSIILSN